MSKIDKKEKICPYFCFDGNHYAVKFYQLKWDTMLSNRYITGQYDNNGNMISVTEYEDGEVNRVCKYDYK